MEFDRYKLTWYMQEICMHALGAKIEYHQLNAALEDDETRQTRLVWFHLSSLLSHSAMISKYLSPISKSAIAVARKNALRAVLCIDSNSEILPRDTRDNVEHFDERIDNWVCSENQNLLEIVLPDRAAFNFMRASEKRVKRVLILDEFVFVSENKDESQLELSLWSLHDEVQRVATVASNWITENSPYHFIYP